MGSSRSRAARAHPSDAAAHEVRAALEAVRRIVQALRVVGGDGKGGAGMSSAQLFALKQIAEHPSASINDVAALTFTHQSSVSVVVQRLVRQRLVAKVAAADDRRRQHVVVTAKGRAVLRRAPVSVQERLIDAIATLSLDDRRVLARSLGHVARLVTPAGAGKHAPMFFEERPGRREPKARSTRSGD